MKSLFPNVYSTNTLQYTPELCTDCGMCIAVCPHAVFAADGGAARLVNPQGCMECGACELNCPAGAIVVDSGVGCATAMILAALRGQKEPTCGEGVETPGCACS